MSYIRSKDKPLHGRPIMAASKPKIKTGMGGSRCGRGRREPTAVLKHDSKKARRAAGKAACRG